MAVKKGKDEHGFGEAIHDGQSLGFACDGETLALKVHGVTGARLGGGVASEKAVGEAALTFLIFTCSAVREPPTNVILHGGPVVVVGERGMDFSVGDVVEIGVMLASEGFAEGGIGGEGVGVDRGQAGGVGELGVFPGLEGRREGEVAGGGERREQRGRTVVSEAE